nr:hypothetical protein Cduv_343 [Cedratvirus duvanny]
MLPSKLFLVGKVGRENDWYQTARLVLSCPSSKVGLKNDWFYLVLLVRFGHEKDWYQTCFLVS